MSASKEPSIADALLLTGAPGVGKTTAIKKVARRQNRVAGFFTEEIRQNGSRQGFRLVPFEGNPRILAHVDIDSKARVSKYGVDVDMLEEVASTLLRPDPKVDLYIIDEIGKMECFSARFVECVRALLNGEALVLATIAARGAGFIAEVKARPDVEIWEVTRGNRDEIPVRAIDWLDRRRVSPKGS